MEKFPYQLLACFPNFLHSSSPNQRSHVSISPTIAHASGFAIDFELRNFRNDSTIERTSNCKRVRLTSVSFWCESKNFAIENSFGRNSNIDIFEKRMDLNRNGWTHLRQEFQQAEDDERHRRCHRQTELHESKVDAYVASADVNVRQQDDECDGWLQKAAAATDYNNDRDARGFNWWNLFGRQKASLWRSGNSL